MSENANIAKAFVAFQAEVPHIGLDSTVRVTLKSGGQYTFDYATLGNIINTVRPVMSKNKLAIMQMIAGRQLKTLLIHESGESYESTAELPIKDGMTTQEQGATISYFRRYSAVCMLGLVTEDDDDGNIADGNQFEKKTPDWGKKPATNTASAAVHADLKQKVAADKEKIDKIATTFGATPDPAPPATPAKEPPKPETKPLEQDALAVLDKRIEGAIKNGYSKQMMDLMNAFIAEVGGKPKEQFAQGEALQLLARINKTKWVKDADYKGVK